MHPNEVPVCESKHKLVVGQFEMERDKLKKAEDNPGPLANLPKGVVYSKGRRYTESQGCATPFVVLSRSEPVFPNRAWTLTHYQ